MQIKLCYVEEIFFIMKRLFLIFIFLFFISHSVFSQSVAINTDGSLADASAILDVKSNAKGFLLPRMTNAQRTGISSPATGLLVYQTDGSSGFYYFKSGEWIRLINESIYPGVTICTQKWMDKNLDVTIYRNGDPIPYVTDQTEWAALTTGAWCYYNNDPSTNATYGKLYNWYAVNDPRGLAPIGWHVPTDAEWITLETCLGGSLIAGGAMKVTGTTNWASPNTDATNSSGFAALPGGVRINNGFVDLQNFGHWWSSTEVSLTPILAISRYIFNSGSSLNQYSGFQKFYGLSVRCIRD